jgi:ribulose-phosphate 3-epimerase
MIAKRNPDLFVQVDGGVSEKNVKELIAAGANVFVAGSSVFSADDQYAAIRNLKTPL